MPLIEAAWIGSAGAVGAISITGAGKGPSGGPLFVTPVADAAGHLKMIAWELDDLQVHRRGDSGTLSPAIPVDLIASCASPADDGLAVTAVRDSSNSRFTQDLQQSHAGHRRFFRLVDGSIG